MSRKTKEQLDLDAAAADRHRTAQLLADRLNIWLLQVTGKVITRPDWKLMIAERLMDEFEVKPIWPDAMQVEQAKPMPVPQPVQDIAEIAQQAIPAEKLELSSDPLAYLCLVCQGSGKLCRYCRRHSGDCICTAHVVGKVHGELISDRIVSAFDSMPCEECGGTGRSVIE